MPGMSGLELLRDLRHRGNKIPALMLPARDTIEDRVDGLDAGADDYLVKPFTFPEPLARVRALLRRPLLQIGDLVGRSFNCKDEKRVKTAVDLIRLSGATAVAPLIFRFTTTARRSCLTLPQKSCPPECDERCHHGR